MRSFAVPFALFALPLATLAQTDSTEADRDRMQSLVVRMSSDDGLGVKMMDGDTTTKKGAFSIDTRYKRITITTVPKPWLSIKDSVAQVLKDLRTQRRNQFTYWSGLDIGVNTFLGPDGDTDLDVSADFMQVDHTKSRFFAINFMEQKVEFGSHHAGLLTGMGLEFANYRLANNDQLMYNADSVYGLPIETPEFRKNKLRQIGLRVPLMLEFNTKRAKMPTEDEIIAAAKDTVRVNGKSFAFSNKRNFHVAFGVVGSWYFDTMYKQKFSIDGDDRKVRDKGDYQLLPYRAAATVRLGYGGLNVFAEYALTSLFKDGKGPELTPFNIGITLVGFN